MNTYTNLGNRAELLESITVLEKELSAKTGKEVALVAYSPVQYAALSDDAEALAKNLRATDITAMALAMDNNMTMVCFGLDEENSIIRVVRGEDIGTTVKNHF